MAEISSEVRSIEREQAPQCGVATIEIAESATIEVAEEPLRLSPSHLFPKQIPIQLAWIPVRDPLSETRRVERNKAIYRFELHYMQVKKRHIALQKRATFYSYIFINTSIRRLDSMKKPLVCTSGLLESGGDLLSRTVTSQVPSALKGLTSVFGMGTGGTSSS